MLTLVQKDICFSSPWEEWNLFACKSRRAEVIMYLFIASVSCWKWKSNVSFRLVVLWEFRGRGLFDRSFFSSPYFSGKRLSLFYYYFISPFNFISAVCKTVKHCFCAFRAPVCFFYCFSLQYWSVFILQQLLLLKILTTNNYYKKHLQFCCRLLLISFSPLLNSFVVGLCTTFYVGRMGSSLCCPGALLPCMSTQRHRILMGTGASLVQVCWEAGADTESRTRPFWRLSLEHVPAQDTSHNAGSCGDEELHVAAGKMWLQLPWAPPCCCAVLLAWLVACPQ